MCDEFTDFHAEYPADTSGGAFGYVVHFENIRHTLNMIMRKPI